MVIYFKAMLQILWFCPNVFNYSCNLQKESALREQFYSCRVKGSWGHFQGGTAWCFSWWFFQRSCPMAH